MPGWEDAYAVSDQGRVLSVRRQIIMSPQRKGGVNGDDYLYVNLSRKGKVTRVAVHTLVLTAFVGPRPHGMQACHWDDTPENNRLSNLRWDTHAGNSADKERNNTHCPEGHEYTEENTYRFTRKDGRREKHCRRCRRERYREKHGKGIRTNRTKYNPNRT